MVLSSEFLLLGSFYALEQAGLLIADAAVLLEHRRYPTAAALALLGREELGRHDILLGLWRNTATGVSTYTFAEVGERTKDHDSKQRHAQSGVSYRLQSTDQVAQLINTRQESTPGSESFRRADDAMRLIDERRRSRQPDERARMRERALYVDLVDQDSWATPKALDAQKCADEVKDVIGAYAWFRERIELAEPLYADPLLAAAFARLVDRPNLPSLPRPSMEALLPSAR